MYSHWKTPLRSFSQICNRQPNSMLNDTSETESDDSSEDSPRLASPDSPRELYDVFSLTPKTAPGSLIRKIQLPTYTKKKAFKPFIPKPSIIEFHYFEVKIVSFESFDKFYVIRVDGTSNKEDFMEEMQKFYNTKQESLQKLKVSKHEGFIAAVCDGEGIWRRCIVQSFKDDDCQLLLCDLGTIIAGEFQHLKPLHRKFLPHEQVSIPCCLANIGPKDVNNFTYPEKAIKEFKKLTIDSCFPVKMMVTKVPKNDSPHEVVVFVFPQNGKKINLNAYLVEKLDCAYSTGSYSENMITIDDDDDNCTSEIPTSMTPLKREESVVTVATEKRVEVEVLRVVNPGEFYVSLKQQEQAINQLQIIIANDHFQTQIFKHLSGEDHGKVTFALDELCLVSCSIVKKRAPEIFRGRVNGFEKDSLTYKVFLIDKGVDVKVDSREIFEIPEHIANQPPSAIKMHLHGLIPIGSLNSKWALTSIDIFRHTVNSYATKFISIVGDANERGSIPAVLWGITTEKICAFKQKKFHNINEYLIEIGVVDHASKPGENLLKLERFIGCSENGLQILESSIQPEKAPSNDSNQHKSIMEMIGNVPTDISPKPICSWAEKNYNNEIFLGYPSHIQNDGVIYIQNEQQKAIRKDLEEKLLKVYCEIPKDHYSVVLKLGQPIIAKNPFKSGYYRGVVESLQKNSRDGFQIKFVDYGTIEIVQRDDIYASVIASNIPILTGQYRLGSVNPCNKKSWPTSTIDFIHSEIVGLRVMVTIVSEVNDVKNCSIAAIDDDGACRDVETLLTEQALAEWGVAQALSPSENVQEKSSGKTKIDVFNRNEQDEFKNKFKCQKLEKIVKTLSLPDSITASVEETKMHLRSKIPDIDDESTKFFLSPPTYEKSDNDSQNNTPFSFDFNQSLSHPRRGIRTLPKIRLFDLQASEIDRFECVFANAFNLKVYVTPIISQLSDQIQQLEQKLKVCDESSLKKFSQPEMSIGKFALVKNRGLFMRGFIIKLSSDQTCCHVSLQDSALIKQFKMNKVFKIPKTLLNYPKQTLALNMNGLKVNPNAGDPHDIFKLLQTHLQGETLRAVVRGYDDKNYPNVDLFDKTGKLAYQNLIDKNFFVKC